MSFVHSFIYSVLETWLGTKSRIHFTPLHEGAEAGYGFADDQVLHLECAFVGIKRFRIREETADVIVGGDTVSAAQLSGPCDCLAALSRSECLCDRGMRIRHLSFHLQLCHANQEALRCCNVGNHPSEEVLHHLEGSNRLTELQAFLTILESILVGTHRASGRLPPDHEARHLQNAGGVAERLIFL